MASYFDSANKQIDEGKAALLQAVATGGSAGKAAFDAAQQQASQARQDAINRAAERSALYGVGGDNQTFLGAYDARANQMGVNRANFESGLAQTQSSGESYLEKARSAIPVLEALNANKAADTDSKIRLAIQAAKDKAQAELDKENRAEQRAIERENRAESRAIAREDRAAARKLPKADDLLGTAMALADSPAGIAGTRAQIEAGTPITDDMLMTAQDQAAYARNGDKRYSTDPTVNLARMVGTVTGLSDAQVNSILTPSVINSYIKNTTTKSSEDTIADALATKYDTKGVTPQLAKSVINNVDFKRDVQLILSGAGGKSREEVDAALRKYYVTDRGWNAEYQILAGEYLPLLPTKKQLEGAEE